MNKAFVLSSGEYRGGGSVPCPLFAGSKSAGTEQLEWFRLLLKAVVVWGFKLTEGDMKCQHEHRFRRKLKVT